MVWSISLDRAWSRCQRQYYFGYKMAWPTATDPQRKKAQFLKELTTPELWQGKLVHKIIEKIIIPEVKRRQWPDYEAVVSQAIIVAEKQFAFSRSKAYESTSKKDAEEDYCVLAPHYFGISDNREILDKAIDVMGNALKNLLTSEQMKTFLMGRSMYRIEKTHYFWVGDTTVEAIPDLIMENKQRGGFDVIDWKVATTSGPYDFQVGVYALAIKATKWLFEKAPGEIHGIVINLLEPDPAIALTDPYKINDDILSSIIDIIYEKNEQIEALVKGRKWHELNIADFMFARSIGTCALCNWKSICVEMSDGSPAKFLSDYKPEPTQLTLPFD